MARLPEPDRRGPARRAEPAAPAERTARRRGRRAARLLAVVVSTVVALAAAEIALRRHGGFEPPPSQPRPTRPDHFQRYAAHGYRLFPSRSITYTYPEHNPRTLTLNANRDGFRSRREFDEPDDRPRVLVVGDSFVFGQGVEEEERFTDVLESRRPAWRVDNLGMTGYGADLMLLALEEIGLALEPDVVVFCLYADDFRRVFPYYSGVGYRIPRFHLEDDALVLKPFPDPAWWEELRLVVALGRALQRDEDVMFAFELNGAILERFLSHAGRGGFRPAFVFLPGLVDGPVNRTRRAWLAEFAAARGVPFLDLTGPLLVDAGADAVFIPDNWHYNPHGHAIVAAHLETFLAGRVFGGESMGP